MVNTILFVDDHHAARTVYAETLRNVGYTVLEAGTLPDAEYLTERQRGGIDLLIVEAVLTTTNGWTVARRLKPRYPEMPVLFLSAHPGAALRKEGLLPKGAPFLAEPVAAEDLLRHVCRLAETKRGEKAGTARGGRGFRAAGARRAA